MRRLRVAVIGLGAFGESHVATLRGLEHVELVAVVSRRRERAEEIARRYAAGAAYDDYRRMLADVRPDAVTVATAEHEHRDPVLAALDAGASVLVEKPLATSIADAQAMLEAAARSPGFLMPGHILRFDTRFAGLKAAVARGDLGEIVSVTARRNRPRSLIRSHGRVHPVLVTGVHDLDLMLWLTGRRVTRVRAHHRLATAGDAGHGVWALLAFAGGAVGLLETSWLLPESAGVATDDALAVVGTQGTARVQIDGSPLQIWRESGPVVPDIGYEPRLHGRVGGALREELTYFTTCALAGVRPTIVTAADGLNALVVAQAIMESATRDAEVRVAWPEETGDIDA